MPTLTRAVPPIVLSVETGRRVDDAWAALTEPDRVADWFTDASPAGAVGEPYRLDFGDGSVVEGVVRANEPGRRFAYTWAWADAEPPQQTLVTWTIEPTATGSKISFEHGGWDEAGADRRVRDDHAGYWEGYLEDLVAILEEPA